MHVCSYPSPLLRTAGLAKHCGSQGHKSSTAHARSTSAARKRARARSAHAVRTQGSAGPRIRLHTRASTQAYAVRAHTLTHTRFAHSAACCCGPSSVVARSCVGFRFRRRCARAHTLRARGAHGLCRPTRTLAHACEHSSVRTRVRIHTHTHTLVRSAYFACCCGPSS